MKMLIPLLAMLALATASTTSAQYLSEGWKPGQPVEKGQTGYAFQPAPTGIATPGGEDVQKSARSLASLFSLEAILESAPIQALFGKAGVNISEKLEAARAQSNFWDERIPLITDDNYEELIVEEKFETLEEEKDRLWFIIISLSAAQKEGIHRYVDEQFDSAFNLTQAAGDLSHVRWGRIDYMNVTKITTKWNVWRAPFLVVLKDRGQTLRFYRPGQLRVQAEVLREFLKRDAWEGTEPWGSVFGPGGSREFVMDAFADTLTKIYDLTVKIPRWLLLVLSGSLASVIVNIMHNSSWLWPSDTAAQKAQSETSKPEAHTNAKPTTAGPEPQTATTVTTATKASKGGTSKRKGGKK